MALIDYNYADLGSSLEMLLVRSVNALKIYEISVRGSFLSQDTKPCIIPQRRSLMTLKVNAIRNA